MKTQFHSLYEATSHPHAHRTHCHAGSPAHAPTYPVLTLPPRSHPPRHPEQQQRRYNVEQRRLGDWSELYTKGLPNDMLRLKAKIIGISFNPASPSSLLLHTHNACIAAELELRPPARCIFLDRSSRRARGQQALNAEAPVKKRARLSNGSGSGSGKKSEEKSEGATGKFTVIERFRPTLFAGYVDDDEMVVVQRPWLQIMQHFPDPLRVNRFGS